VLEVICEGLELNIILSVSNDLIERSSAQLVLFIAR
jgi:hypothetical protein